MTTAHDLAMDRITDWADAVEILTPPDEERPLKAATDTLHIFHLPGKHDQAAHGHGLGGKNWKQTNDDAQTALAGVAASPLRETVPLGGGWAASVSVEHHQDGTLVRKKFPPGLYLASDEPALAAAAAKPRQVTGPTLDELDEAADAMAALVAKYVGRVAGHAARRLGGVLTAGGEPPPLHTFHLPGKHDQASHGHPGFGEDALHAEAALSSAALAVENPSAGQASALRRMGGDGAYVVNKDLRANSGDISRLTDRNRGTVEDMDSLMKSSPLASDVVVYRRAQVRDVFGNDVEHVGDLTGLSWHDHAYVSTSTSPRAALSGSANMRILVKAGTPGFSHSELDPDEILLGRGLTFDVVADHRGENVGGSIDVVVHS